MQGHVRMIKVLLKGVRLLYVRKNWVKISLVCLVLVALGVTLAGCSKPKTEEESTVIQSLVAKVPLFLQLQRLLGIQA